MTSFVSLSLVVLRPPIKRERKIAGAKVRNELQYILTGDRDYKTEIFVNIV